jgi:hypothetical protein
MASVRVLVRRAGVRPLRDCAYRLQHYPDDSLRISARYVLGFPFSADLR